jgi:peptide/nickel transport system permease protein
MVRGETLGIMQQDFIAYSKVAGTSTTRTLLRHLLPNVIPTLLVLSTLEIGWAIILESSLSFLGVGIPPPQPAWGSMVADGRRLIATSWWVSIFPGLVILGIVLSLNTIGDWLRDRLDPKRRQM